MLRAFCTIHFDFKISAILLSSYKKRFNLLCSEKQRLYRLIYKFKTNLHTKRYCKTNISRNGEICSINIIFLIKIK